jgi:hypothetical protein
LDSDGGSTVTVSTVDRKDFESVAISLSVKLLECRIHRDCLQGFICSTHCTFPFLTPF